VSEHDLRESEPFVFERYELERVRTTDGEELLEGGFMRDLESGEQRYVRFALPLLLAREVRDALTALLAKQGQSMPVPVEDPEPDVCPVDGCERGMAWTVDDATGRPVRVCPEHGDPHVVG
jgi:hypothetical protein